MEPRRSLNRRKAVTILAVVLEVAGVCLVASAAWIIEPWLALVVVGVALYLAGEAITPSIWKQK